MENTNYPLQENIQALVNSQLDEVNKKALIEQANTDPLVAEQLAFSQSLALALRHSDMVNANLVLKQVILEEGFPPPPSIKPGWRSWRTWVLSSALAIVVLGSYWVAESQGVFDSKAQELSRSAAGPLENVLFLPKDGEGLASLTKGMEAYDKGDFKQADRWLTTYVNQRPDNAARVYLGVSRLFAGKAKLAMPPLLDAAKSDEPPIREAALWYLALAQLENNDLDAANTSLQSLPNDGLYGTQAQALLEKLKQK